MLRKMSYWCRNVRSGVEAESFVSKELLENVQVTSLNGRGFNVKITLNELWSVVDTNENKSGSFVSSCCLQ